MPSRDPPSVRRRRGGLALRLVDPLAPVVLLGLVLGWRQGAFFVRRRAAHGLGRALLADDQVPEDLLGDEQAAFELADRGRGRLEDDDVVRAFALALDGVG